MDTEIFFKSLLEIADIRINGTRPWDILVHDKRLFTRVFLSGTMGLGDSYVEGWWDCEEIDTMICKALKANLAKRIKRNTPLLYNLYTQLRFSLQHPFRKSLYDTLFNPEHTAFYSYLLGESMEYSCGYWKNAGNVIEAQEHTLALILDKLQLKPGMHILDIGCGWGALPAYLAIQGNVQVTALCHSKSQMAYAKNHYNAQGITWVMGKVLPFAHYDRILAMGTLMDMPKNKFPVFFQHTRRLLKHDGLLLMHTIGKNPRHGHIDPWVRKNFRSKHAPPSLPDMCESFADLYIMEDWHNFGADYDKTIMAWDSRFRKGVREKKLHVEAKTNRALHYYLCCCAGTFRARQMQIWQVVLSPEGVHGGYCCSR